MPKTQPWHSTRTGEKVHHDNPNCTEGNNIEKYYFAWEPVDARCATITIVSIRKAGDFRGRAAEHRGPARTGPTHTDRLL